MMTANSCWILVFLLVIGQPAVNYFRYSFFPGPPGFAWQSISVRLDLEAQIGETCLAQGHRYLCAAGSCDLSGAPTYYTAINDTVVDLTWA